MARRWTSDEENRYRKELYRLYVTENKTIHEIGVLLALSDASVYDRLIRLGIPTSRQLKPHADNRRSDVRVPSARSEKLAEFFGIMLGDGHVGHYQVMVTLGTKEAPYAQYVQRLMQEIFGGVPKLMRLKRGHSTVYLGSTLVTKWLKYEGLVQNKVAAQVDVPVWIFEKPEYMQACLRGFFDTDGSVYKLRYGMQVSFTNHSMPLLASLQRMLRELGYSPSVVSAYRMYLTRVPDVRRFFAEIQPKNPKHVRRYKLIARRWRSSKRT